MSEYHPWVDPPEPLGDGDRCHRTDCLYRGCIYPATCPEGGLESRTTSA